MNFCQMCHCWFPEIERVYPEVMCVSGEPFKEYAECCSLGCTQTAIYFGKIHHSVIYPLVRREQTIEV